MIADYPMRAFQLWEYRVSHGSMLIRSPQSLSEPRNVDIGFDGVEYVALPRFLRGVRLERGSPEDAEQVERAGGRIGRSHLYVVISEGNRHLVVASSCTVQESDMDIFDSPFEFPRGWHQSDDSFPPPTWWDRP